MLCKTLWRKRGTETEFLIHSLICSNKLANFQLITVLVFRSSPPKSHKKGYLNFSKNLEKYVLMNSFLEPKTLLKTI